MKYDSKLKAMTEEVSTLTQHMSKYRRERDTYKEMLDGTQRTIAELKGSTGYKSSRADNASEVRFRLCGGFWCISEPRLIVERKDLCYMYVVLQVCVDDERSVCVC